MREIAISPHPDAPHLSNVPDAQKIIKELIVSATSRNLSLNGEDLMYMREAALVNLWFFLRGIAAYTGPFEKLDTDLNWEMCNFRQLGLINGARIAAFISRGFFKSTILTSGGNGWEMLRNPNICIRIFNAVVGKAEEFMHTTQRIFDSNDLFRALFEEYVPAKNQDHWNETEAILPNRQRTFTEPTISVGGITGASEGGHYDLLSLDDLIGLKQLNSERQSSADMEKTTNWFRSNTRSLLRSIAISRIVLVATRYAVDDSYETIMQNMKSFVGYPEALTIGSYEVRQRGVWDVYYRCAEENMESIKPDIITTEELHDLAEDDPWTYMTQYQNLPQASGLVEFSEMKTKKFTLDGEKKWDGSLEWSIIKGPIDGQGEIMPLDRLDIVGGVDPAATDKHISARTSRTAVTVWGQDSETNKYLIDLRVGYIGLYEMFDWIFALNAKYRGLIRFWAFEANAYQKVLKEVSDNEMKRRKDWALFMPVNATGDKVVRIRGSLATDLAGGKIYVNEACCSEFDLELKIFPQNRYKMDVMDSSVHAIKQTTPPFNDEEWSEVNEQDTAFANRQHNQAGW